MNAIRVLIAAGGTGGHVYPGIAIAEAFQKQFPEAAVRFVGTERGLEKRLLPSAGYDLDFVRASRVKNAGIVQRLYAIARMPLGMWDANKVLRAFKPNIVVSVGGYSAAPTVLMAWLRRIPTATVEPNAVPGLTNRVLGRLANKVFVGFEHAAGWYRPHKVTVVGVPLRQAVVSRIVAAREGATTSKGGLSILVFGGSQGARFLNERVPQTLKGLSVRVLHQTGEADRELVDERYRSAGITADVRPYIDDMAAAYAQTDLAITRAGASSVAELAASGTPAILVPFPYAADDHQAANAEALATAGGARMIRQGDWDDDDVRQWIDALQRSEDVLPAMAKASLESARPDAAHAVVEGCAALLARSGVSLLGWVA